MKIDVKPILRRLFSWGKRVAAEEIEAEVERRVQERLPKTTTQSDQSASSLTPPKG